MIQRLLMGFFSSLLLFILSLQAGTAPVTISVDLRSPITESALGFGVQWDPYDYPPSPESWKLTLSRLDYMRPSFFRVMWSTTPYCLGFNESGEPRYAWQDSPETAEQQLKPLYNLLDYAQSHNIDVMLGEWAPPRGLNINGPGDPRWARAIAGFVEYLINEKKYTVIRYYNYMNEPNGGWMWPGRKVDYTAWAEGVRNLRHEFDSRGLNKLPIAGPDNSGSWDWIDRCARELAPEIGAWEMHWYAKDREVVSGQIGKLLDDKRRVLLENDKQAPGKVRFMGEAGLIDGRMNGDQQPRVKDFVYGVLMADYAAQVLRAGWMGAIAWDLDDALHVVNGKQRTVPPNDLTLKIWGFWNSQAKPMGHPEDESMRPWFYTWSLMSRLIPKGAAIVRVTQELPIEGFRATAATWSGKVTIMLVNDTEERLSFSVRVPGAPRGKWTQYRYFERQRAVNADGFPVPASSIRGGQAMKVDLPARGVVFLTTAE